MIATFSTDAVAPRERLAYWREAICDAVVHVDVEPLNNTPSFYSRLDTTSAGSVQLTRLIADAQRVHRSPRQIAKSCAEEYLVDLVVSGDHVASQDGRESILSAGDLTLYDATRPYWLHTEGHTGHIEHVVLRVPRALLDSRCSGLDRMTAVTVSGRKGMGPLVAAYLGTLVHTIDAVEPSLGGRLVATALDLVATAFCVTSGDPSRADPSAVRAAHVQRIRSYVELHLGDPDLTPDAVAAAAHVSTRYLHKLLAVGESTTFNRWVKERRLECCRRDLADARHATRTVTEIAFAWGFRDLASFSRAFRERYGASPREYRTAAADDHTADRST